jgi:hypothetical protein
MSKSDISLLDSRDSVSLDTQSPRNSQSFDDLDALLGGLADTTRKPKKPDNSISFNVGHNELAAIKGKLPKTFKFEDDEDTEHTATLSADRNNPNQFHMSVVPGVGTPEENMAAVFNEMGIR